MSCFTHYWILISIMLLSGILGGVVNYFIVFTESVEKEVVVKYLFWKSLLLGVSASFMVPLFLSTISSELLSKPIAGTFNSDYLVLVGFCLLAAIVSKQFIESLYQKVIKAEDKANLAMKSAAKATKKAESVEELLTENDDKVIANLTDSIDPIQEKIIDAMKNSRFAWRSLTGISKDSNEKSDIVKSVIDEMIEKGILTKRVNSKGQLRYKIRPY